VREYTFQCIWVVAVSSRFEKNLPLEYLCISPFLTDMLLLMDTDLTEYKPKNVAERLKNHKGR